MKRQYQISKRRAAQQFEQWAKDNPVPIQLTFPTAGIAELAGCVSVGNRNRLLRDRRHSIAWAIFSAASGRSSSRR